MPTTGERKFRYLDLHPEQFRDPSGVLRTKKNVWRWGASSCFKETDLYTVKHGRYKFTDIERFFFGKVDKTAARLSNSSPVTSRSMIFVKDLPPEKLFHSLINYMSVQKFRTPKGLRYLSALIHQTTKINCCGGCKPFRTCIVRSGRRASGRSLTKRIPRRNLSSLITPSQFTIVRFSRRATSRESTQTRIYG